MARKFLIRMPIKLNFLIPASIIECTYVLIGRRHFLYLARIASGLDSNGIEGTHHGVRREILILLVGIIFIQFVLKQTFIVLVTPDLVFVYVYRQRTRIYGEVDGVYLKCITHGV